MEINLLGYIRIINNLTIHSDIFEDYYAGSTKIRICFSFKSSRF